MEIEEIREIWLEKKLGIKYERLMVGEIDVVKDLCFVVLLDLFSWESIGKSYLFSVF